MRVNRDSLSGMVGVCEVKVYDAFIGGVVLLSVMAIA